MEDVAERRARLESDLRELRQQFIDKARVIERMRVDVQRLESLAALSRHQRSELERLNQHIEEHSETLRSIRQDTDKRRAEYAELERTTSIRRRSLV